MAKHDYSGWDPAMRWYITHGGRGPICRAPVQLRAALLDDDPSARASIGRGPSYGAKTILRGVPLYTALQRSGAPHGATAHPAGAAGTRFVTAAAPSAAPRWLHRERKPTIAAWCSARRRPDRC